MPTQLHLPILAALGYRQANTEAEQAPEDMTALKEYARLESTGLWRDAVDGQRREVGLIFGNASLVIVDNANRPLTHWSMPAMRRTNPGQMPAIYTPDAAGAETLELSDDLMIGAIEKVLRSVARSTPRPGRLRNAGIAFTLSVVLGLGIFWLPGALVRQTLLVMPVVKRSEIGATLLGHIQRMTAPTCRDPLGTQALAQFSTRLFGSGRGQIVVIPDGPDGGLTHVIDLPRRHCCAGAIAGRNRVRTCRAGRRCSGRHRPPRRQRPAGPYPAQSRVDDNPAAFDNR